ncbi:adhesion G-protein coupled receptor G2-like isoform X2 [Haplochromis burtoni]|uniref:adhesion G-protein coupled receptor G2-like isoform X2 n=1 Tax=Haplochromis burtoni TaxID=8153 RepID=UPI0003BD369A|nr:adhesion G-protein coupled receptor G2-like isoform X2 [Haplochromis burtoni]
MERKKSWIFWWLMPFMSYYMLYQNCLSEQYCCQTASNISATISRNQAECCMNYTDSVLNGGNLNDTLRAIWTLEKVLERTEVNGSMQLYVKTFVALLHKPSGPFGGLEIYANDTKVTPDVPLLNSKVIVQLPRELGAGPNNTFVFCMFKWPETNKSVFESPHEVYDQRLVGLSVQGKKISGLQERINITMEFTKKIDETQKPSCQFFNYSTYTFREDGCVTHWTHRQNNITCSCNHLTYFGILIIPDPSITKKDQEILTHITVIGCSISLFTLVIAILLFITNRKLRQDVSMKVHINLVIALMLLNLHFLPSQAGAAGSSSGLCLYMALLLHYSLLATFSWMALEGFHLYLLLVKVFNIYVKKYLLKLGVVGWGVPAMIVSVVVIIDRTFYGLTPVDASNSSSTAICYITNDKVKWTTVGLFSLVFLFNVIMFGVTVRQVFILHHTRGFGQNNLDKFKKDICSLAGVMTLLGITWGLVLFSFGPLTTPALYLFCILNSLQGFFIFLWFVMSLRKVKTSATKMSSETRSTNG